MKIEFDFLGNTIPTKLCLIVSIMELQSYDDCLMWQHMKIEIINKDREIYEPCVVRVYFIYKDNY